MNLIMLVALYLLLILCGIILAWGELNHQRTQHELAAIRKRLDEIAEELGVDEHVQGD